MKILVMVDEASKLLKTHLMFTHPIGSNRNATATEVWDILSERWFAEHGPPRLLRLDSEGAFNANMFSDRCSDLMIELEMSAGEAHWQLGITENVILDLDGALRKLMDSRPDLDPKELLGRGTLAHNQMERHKGFSPMQWAYGRGQTWDNTLFDVDIESPLGMTDEKLFLEGLERQQAAETAYLSWKRSAQVDRATKARGRINQQFQPGQAVMVWRRGKGTTRREGRGSGEGPWSG
jgi:hypothetical protein